MFNGSIGNLQNKEATCIKYIQVLKNVMNKNTLTDMYKTLYLTTVCAIDTFFKAFMKHLQISYTDPYQQASTKFKY